MTVECLAQEHSTVPWAPGFEPAWTHGAQAHNKITQKRDLRFVAYTDMEVLCYNGLNL